MTLEDLTERDGGVCMWCGRAPWPSDLTAEHLLPRLRGGRGEPENLALACRKCNRRRRSRSVAAYVLSRRRAGEQTSVELVTRALRRLAASPSPTHADYGARQLELLSRERA
jgi:5-methylcytosine-specific restriction endonuclease McrA